MIKLPWWIWAGLGNVLLIAAVAWYAYAKGGNSVQRDWGAAVARGSAEVARLKAEAGTVTTVTEVKTIYRDKLIYEKGRDIIRTVEVFVPATDQCMLSGGFRVFHDASADNTVPDPAAIADAAPVLPQTVAVTVGGNYTGCHRNAAKLEQWQQWAIEQCEISPDCPVDMLREWAQTLTTDADNG